MTDAHTLLAKALRTLTDEEQGIVLQSLLAPGLDLTRFNAFKTAAGALTDRVAYGTDSGNKTGLLLRIPTSTHAALKAWSDEHGRSMNVVARGLIEQFLDNQKPAKVPASRPLGLVEPSATTRM